MLVDQGVASIGRGFDFTTLSSTKFSFNEKSNAQGWGWKDQSNSSPILHDPQRLDIDMCTPLPSQYHKLLQYTFEKLDVFHISIIINCK